MHSELQAPDKQDYALSCFVKILVGRSMIVWQPDTQKSPDWFENMLALFQQAHKGVMRQHNVTATCGLFPIPTFNQANVKH